VGSDRGYQVLGVPIAITCDDAAVAEDVDRLLGAFVAPTSTHDVLSRYRLTRAGSGDHMLLCGCQILARSPSQDAVMSELVRQVNNEVLRAFTGFAVHAGVVAAGRSAIAFPAASGVGKSTLTAACLSRGCSYVSDEALCIDFDTAHVIPYPKPISLSVSSMDLLGLPGCVGSETLVTASELGAATVAGPTQLRHVVEIVRLGDRARLVPVSRSAGLAALLRYSFNHYKRPAAAFALVGRLAADFHAWRLECGSPDEAADALLAAMDSVDR